MKKLLTLTVIALVICTNACKKSDSNKKTSTGTNSWTLAGVTYKTAITNKGATSGGDVTTLVNFWDAAPTSDLKVNAVSLSFGESPTASGTYQLVGGVGGTLTAKQFELAAGTHELYYAYLGPSIDVTVTVTNGKIKVTIPEISLKCTTSSPDAKLTATIQEL